MSKILLYDIETSSNEGRFFGHYDVKPIQITRPAEMLSVAWKYYNEKSVHSLARKDYRKVNGDRGLAQGLYDVMTDDDVNLIIAHNLKGFDHQVANTAFKRHKIFGVPNTPVFDTLEVARKYFKFPGNSLDELGQFLGLGAKLETGGRGLWIRCMDSDPAALRKMREYNEHDVTLLELVYRELAPYARNVPNLNLLTNPDDIYRCPVATCGSGNTQKRGYNVSAKGRQQRYQCQDCGHWFSVKAVKPKIKLVKKVAA